VGARRSKTMLRAAAAAMPDAVEPDALLASPA
jgi:hypothetical protein